jgi:hydrogenase expression/formation protein HypE
LVQAFAFRVAAVLFDFDGTLTVPETLDFGAVRRAVGCPPGLGLLEFLAGIEDAEERRAKEAVLEAMEAEAAERTRENEGATELVESLHRSGVPMGIITRNRRDSIDRSLAKLPGIDPSFFSVIVTRDLPLSPKPFPDGVLYAADQFGVDVGELLVVGDYAFDIDAGKRAGALAMYLYNDPSEPFYGQGADFVVHSLAEAQAVIRRGLPLPTGKLPADLLEHALSGLVAADPSVLVGAAVGEDAAAIDIEAEEVLVLASDPVTLAADALSRYAVLVNANDVATSGATPRWLIVTLLFPPGSTASEIAVLVEGIQAVCADNGIALCGGHTEISDAVSSPLVVGTMAGTAKRAELIVKRRMGRGDRILLTKAIAVEGTGLIAREFAERLLAGGMTSAEVAASAAFLDRIGVLEEAQVARRFPGVTAMHDVTEGGLATAVRELGAAGCRRLRLHLDRIPIYPETARICGILDLDPLGLIGSGSLLITVAADEAGTLAVALAEVGIEVSDIGEVLEQGEGVEALRDGVPAILPRFERDEVSRLGTGGPPRGAGGGHDGRPPRGAAADRGRRRPF